MMHLRARTWLYLALLLLLLGPAAVPTAAAQRAVDDTWIAFTSLAPGEEGIWVVHPDGSGLARLTEGRDIYPTWSPDGTLLAYVHEVSGTVVYGNVQGYASEIRIVDTAGQIRYTVGRDAWVDGEAATRLAGNVGLPQWSSDGQALSYGVDLQFFFIVAWGGRRTFYLDPPRIEVGRGPQGSLLSEGTVMLDQSWGPGPVPTWVRTTADLTSCQVMAYDQTLLNIPAGFFFNPRWSASGQHLTVYRQTNEQEQFSNALLQVNAAGEVERTLFESDDLYLYTIAEPSPDGQRHLVGVSADMSVWFLQALGSMFQEPEASGFLPLEPPPTGYLYVVDQSDARQVVAQPRPGTVDLVSRQPWSPDGDQVVFMRAPHPAAEGTVESGLGIYVGPPGQAARIVPFSAAELAFELTLAYPVWQPVPQGPLPTMVPLVPATPEPTAAPTTGPAAPSPTATPTPQRSPTAASSPVYTPQLTATPTPAAPAAPQSNLRTYLLIGIGVLLLALLAVIAWTLLRPERPEGGARTLRLPDSVARLFRPRQAHGEGSARSPFRSGLRRTEPAEGEKPPPSGGLLHRTPQPVGGSRPKKPFALFSRRPKPTPEPPAEPAEAAADEVAPEAVFPSLRARHEGPADWPDVDHGSAPAGPEEPAPAAAPVSLTPVAGPGVSGPARPSLSPDPDLLQGIAHVRAGKLAEGMVSLQKVIQRTPEEGTAWLWLGWAAARQNQRVLAERCFVRAQELGVEQAEQALAWLRKG